MVRLLWSGALPHHLVLFIHLVSHLFIQHWSNSHNMWRSWAPSAALRHCLSTFHMSTRDMKGIKRTKPFPTLNVTSWGRNTGNSWEIERWYRVRWCWYPMKKDKEVEVEREDVSKWWSEKASLKNWQLSEGIKCAYVWEECARGGNSKF